MFCKKCGAKLPDGAKFCKKCGEPVVIKTDKKIDEKVRENLSEKNGKKPKPKKQKGKHIKYILALLISLVLILILIVKNTGNTNENVISEIEWMQLLSERVEIQGIELEETSENDCTGEFAIVTAMLEIGKNNIELIADKNEYTEEELVELAIQNNIIERSWLNSSITEAEANEILDRVIQYCFDMENYPEYFSIDYACEVVDINEEDILEFDEEKETLYIGTQGTIPSEGQVVLIRNEYGIAKPRRILEVYETSNGRYEFALEKLSDPSELYDEIAFSGKADFSYLLGASEDNSVEVYTSNKLDNSSCSNQINLLGAEIVHAAEEKSFATTVDIEAGGKVEAKIKSKGKKTSYPYSYSSYLKVSDEEKETTYKVEIDKDDKITLTVVQNGVTLEAKEEAKKADSGEKFVLETGLEGAFYYKAQISDLQIAAAYCASGSKEDKYVDIKMSCDTELSWTIVGKFEGKIPIAEVEVPIAGTCGLARVEVRLFLVVNASGEVSLIYEMEDISFGINASSEGFSFVHDRNRDADRLNINTKVKVGIGVTGEVALAIGDWVGAIEYDVVDPQIKVMIEASTEMLKNNKGYEEYPNCVQVSVAAPTVTVDVSSKESLLYELLNMFGWVPKLSYEIITAENAPFKIERHIETELDGTTNTLIGNVECCTHVKNEESTEVKETEVKETEVKETEGEEDIDLSTNPEATEDDICHSL